MKKTIKKLGTKTVKNIKSVKGGNGKQVSGLTMENQVIEY